MRYKNILFDLDGLLCDPGSSITDSIQFALVQVGIEENDQVKLRGFVGPPLHHTFKTYGLDDAQIKETVRIFRKHFQIEGIRQYKAYPGMLALLRKLKQQDLTLAVATSKILPFANKILTTTNMIDYFDYVAGSDPDNPPPKAATIAEALEHLGNPNQASCIMLGDREHDVIAANKNHIDSIGVLYGYGNRKELENSGATYVVESVEDIGNILLNQ